MKLIYGLGNPGNRYAYTRHNIGFLVTDHLSEKWHIPLKKEKHRMVYGRGFLENIPVMLAKPYTYMNLSGEPLRSIEVEPEDLIVIHDDMDIPFGQVRVKSGGGTGGHKGVASVVEALSDNGFVRIRCGIGRPVNCCDPSDYVLGQFSQEDLTVVRSQLDDAASAVEMCIRDGVTRAMNVYNRRDRDIPST
jgi:PTH1 family peptidyl-tRNA hydrolase